MTLSTKGKIRTGYLLAFILLLVSYILIFYSTYQLRLEAKKVTHTFIVINKLHEISRLITEAETSVRGYIITKDSGTLNLYNAAVIGLPAAQKDLVILVSDNEAQLKKLDTMNRLLNERMSMFSFGISTFQQANLTITQSMDNLRAKSRNIMDSIR